MTRSRAVCAAVIAAQLALAAAFPAFASGHAAFADAQPEPGTRLQQGPAEIKLTFTEPLNRGLSRATLVNTDTGEEIAAVLATGGQRELVLRPQVRLARAPYIVRWHTVSTLDGHPLEGSFGFGVRTAAAAGAGQDVEQSPLARGGWLRIATRALFYAALFFFAGGVLNGTLLASRGSPERWLVPAAIESAVRRSGADPERRAERLWDRTLSAGGIALTAAIAVALIETADAGGGLSAHSVNGYLLSNGAGLARVATVAAIALTLLLARVRAAVAASVALVIGFLTIALSGHANSAGPRFLAVITDWVHLLAASVWVGGIAQLAAAWLPGVMSGDQALRTSVIRFVLGRFGQVALVAFMVVVASGSVNALIQLGRPQELWTSAYGRVLALKIGLVGLIAAASYVHALRIRPRLLEANPHPSESLERRHWRLLSVEPWLGLGALVAVAALVAFPLPPRQLDEANRAEAASPCSPACPLPAPGPDQLAVADHVGPNIAAFWLRQDGESLSGTLRLLNLNLRPVEGSAELDEGDVEECGTGCWRLSGVPRVPEFRVAISVGDQKADLEVPAEWRPDQNRAAQNLLAAAQQAMRAQRSSRLAERLTSGLGLTAHTAYRFLAPDRMAYRTSSGTTVIAIGKVSYDSIQGAPFRKGPFGADGFRLASAFNWTVYGRSVRWLGANRRYVRLALFDPATPV